LIFFSLKTKNINYLLKVIVILTDILYRMCEVPKLKCISWAQWNEYKNSKDVIDELSKCIEQQLVTISELEQQHFPHLPIRERSELSYYKETIANRDKTIAEQKRQFSDLLESNKRHLIQRDKEIEKYETKINQLETLIKIAKTEVTTAQRENRRIMAEHQQIQSTHINLQRDYVRLQDSYRGLLVERNNVLQRLNALTSIDDDDDDDDDDDVPVQFPKHILNDYIELHQLVGRDITCPVCLDGITKDSAKISKCGHIYCSGCFPRILESKKCGVCRCDL